MNTDLLFNELEPPRGGAEQFAQRLERAAAERPNAVARSLALAAAVAAVAVLASVVLLRSGDEAVEVAVAEAPPTVEIYGAPDFDRLLGRALQPAELTVVVNAETALVTEIETANEKVRIYQIN